MRLRRPSLFFNPWSPMIARLVRGRGRAAPEQLGATRALAARAPPPRDSLLCAPQLAFATHSTRQLARALLVLQTCSVRPLVAHADALLRLSRRVLGEAATQFVVRNSFFAHFCAGEDKAGIAPVVARLRGAGIGSILDYAAEADVQEADADAAA